MVSEDYYKEKFRELQEKAEKQAWFMGRRLHSRNPYILRTPGFVLSFKEVSLVGDRFEFYKKIGYDSFVFVNTLKITEPPQYIGARLLELCGKDE